jgi:transposase InsO family protein
LVQDPVIHYVRFEKVLIDSGSAFDILFRNALTELGLKQEYKPLAKATAKKPTELLDDIIHRFGLPNCIITDLGSTFTGSDFCDDRGIVVKYVSVAHPRANGQVERANGMILDALKKRLYRENDQHPGRWLKELPAVV